MTMLILCMKMFVYIMTMFVYILAGQGVLTNIGTTELNEECDEEVEISGETLIYLVERMLASCPPHDDLCQLANPDVIGTHAHAQAPCRHTTKHGTGARGVQVPMSGGPAQGLLMLIERRLCNSELAPGCTTRVLDLHAPHAQLEWLAPFMPIAWRTSLPLLSNTERDHHHASIRQHARVPTHAQNKRP